MHQDGSDEYKKAQYSVEYFYCSDVEGGYAQTDWSKVTVRNTQRVKADGFLRMFASDIYVSNIFNKIYLQKTNHLGEPINGAVFDLYRTYALDGYDTSKTIENDDGTLTILSGAVPYDTVTTGTLTGEVSMEGGAVFPSGLIKEGGAKTLPLGSYYVVERQRPEGYTENPRAVKGFRVLVHRTGIYVDACDPNDGITVEKEVGKIVGSVRRFRDKGNIDSTLSAILVSMSASDYLKVEGIVDMPGYSNLRRDWHRLPIPQRHMTYIGPATNGRDYGFKEETEAQKYICDDGYGMLSIIQCDDSLHTSGVGNITDLPNVNLSYMFDNIITIRVENTKNTTGGLTISKKVTGKAGNTEELFGFSVTLDNSEITGKYGDVNFTKGTAVFSLKHGEKVNISGLPTGTRYTVKETDADTDGYVTTVPSAATGRIPEDNGVISMEFVNNREKLPPQPAQPQNPQSPGDSQTAPGGNSPVKLPHTGTDFDLQGAYVAFTVSFVLFASAVIYFAVVNRNMKKESIPSGKKVYKKQKPKKKGKR